MSPITIHSVNLIAECERFNYNSECSICLNSIKKICNNCINDQSNTYIGDQPPIFCPIVIGECKHAFHSHCIGGWLKLNNKCPYDNKEWKIS